MQTPRTSQPRPTAALAPKRASLRTCVGCGEEASPETLIRLVLAGDHLVVDAAGGSFGRGAHVHPRPACLAKAERGLAKSFRQALSAPPAELATAIVSALGRRAEGLLATAHRLHQVQVGADAVLASLAAGAALVVVACDAGSIAHSHEITAAVAQGRAVAWSTRAHLGNLLNRNEVALLAMTGESLASALATAIHTMSALSPVAEVTAPSARAHAPEWKGEACKSPEVR